MGFFDYIHKSPHRNQLEKYLAKFLPEARGPILDIGSKNRRYDHLLKQKPIALDLVENKEKDVQKGDILNLKFNAESFSTVLCFEVLEYVLNTDQAISEVSRVLIKEGVFLLSQPFMYGFHQDKVRYTAPELSQKLKKYFSSVEIYSVGNFYTIILDILRGKIIKRPFLKYFFYCLYFPLTFLIPLSKFFADESYVSGYFIKAKK